MKTLWTLTTTRHLSDATVTEVADDYVIYDTRYATFKPPPEHDPEVYYCIWVLMDWMLTLINPPIEEPPPPTPIAEVMQYLENVRTNALASANAFNQQMHWFLAAEASGTITPEEAAKLQEWRDYYLAVGRPEIWPGYPRDMTDWPPVMPVDLILAIPEEAPPEEE